MILVGILGIFIGNLLGIILCMKLVPYILGILGISTGNMTLQFNSVILIVSIVVTIFSILLGMKKPIQIATKVTPVEAAKYRECISNGKRYKKRKGAFFWRMAFEQFKKDKKKTVVVLLSLATSLSVFYCLTTIISSQGERTVLPNYWNADFVVQNQTQTTEDINSLKPAISDSFVEEIRKMDGIKDLHLVEGTPIIFPYVLNSFSDMWITNYIDRTPYLSSEDVKSDYKANPSNYYGMLIGIDEEQFDYVNQSLDTPIDKQDFLNGKSCIVQFEGSEIPKEYLNQRVLFNLQGKQYEIAVEAVSIYYNQKYDEVLEKKITSLVEDNPYSNDLHIESQFENMRTIQESQGEMMEIGTIIALLLLFVGVLNYANTIASGIQNRRLIFSVMESIGMSRKQINQLLIREGILYAIFSIFVTLTIGSAITYVCFQSMNYMRIPFKVPVIPLISSIILVVLICTLAPLLSYKKLVGNHSIVERLRNCE